MLTSIPSHSAAPSVNAKVHKKPPTSNPFKWVRPKSDKDPPKKPLSSYNIYFLLERDRIVNGDTAERMYTMEDVQNIVEQQKWNHTYRKRQHRKTHGKVSFHDLSRVVANNWRRLSDEQKAIFNHQASIEKKIYKQALDTWVMKQMKQGRSATLHSPKIADTSPTDPAAPIRTMLSENNGSNGPIMTTITMHDHNNNNNKNDDDNNNHMHLLSSEEVNYLLGCFNMLPTSHHSTNATDSTNSNHGLNINSHHYDQDPNDWIRLDDNGPLWYDAQQLKGCSEEFALQMIYSSNDSAMYTPDFDRAITL
jgi:HMG-box domain